MRTITKYIPYNTETTFRVSLESAGTGNLQTSPTLAAGDVKVSLDGGAEANLNTLPAVDGTNTRQVNVTVSATESTTGEVRILLADQTSPKEWDDVEVVCWTYGNASARYPYWNDDRANIAAAVWDRVLTGATHNITNSAGRRLRTLDSGSIRDATAQAGSSNSITLDASASATDDIYNNNLIVITGGTGAGQTRIIVEYNGTSKVATVNEVWQTTPDNTSEFQIIADAQADIIQHGLAQAGAASTITLSSSASATNDIYNGCIIYLSTSTGAGQARLITDYDGATKVATVSPAWATNPAANTVYKITPGGRSIVDSLADNAVSAAALAADAVTEIVTGVFAKTIGTRTFEKLIKVMAAVAAGKTSGLTDGYGTLVFRDIDDTGNEVTVTVTSDGNRTAVTIA